MTFDDSISSTVPLSKILDCFIEEEEKPSTIIWFLKDHIDCIEDILNYSEYSDRLFFVDFIAKLSYQEAEEFYSLMKLRISRDKYFFLDYDIQQLYLVWQILQSNIPDVIKAVFKRYLKDSSNTHYHPYRGVSNASKSRIFDGMFNDVRLSLEEVAENINRIKDSYFKEICKSKRECLSYRRMLQKDLFLLLDIRKQFILLNEIKNTTFGYSYYKFFRQILNSNIDTEIKLFVYHIFDPDHYYFENGNFLLTEEMEKLVEESVNYPQLMLKLDLWGVDDFGGELVFYLFCKHKLDWLVDIMESNEELLIEQFDIRDLIKRLKEKDGRD